MSPTTSTLELIAPDETDLLVGYCLGRAEVPPLPRRVADPVVELSNALRPHLDRPWFVSFSGGCDSSLVLAAATSFCRSVGHADPVPLTVRFPALPQTDERLWQEAVVRSLGLDEWEIIEVDDDFDVVGPLAGSLLRRAGPFVSAFIFAEQPLLSLAHGGVLMNGEGGDEVLGPIRLTSALQIAHGLVHRQVPSRRAVRRVWSSMIPERRARDRAAADLTGWWGEWLEPGTRDRLVDRVVAEGARGSWLPRRSLREHLGSRTLVSGLHNLDELARASDVRYVRPLLSPRFVASLVAGRAWLHCRGRAVVLDTHFTQLLPELIRHRTDKVSFNEVYFNRHARAFAERWDGTGVPDGVDVEALRSNWLSPEPNGLTALLLQHAWLHAQPSECAS